MHPSDQIRAIRLFYYIAPSNRSEVTAAPVGENTEYVELVTRGGVFYGEQYHGPGTIFWHFPGDMTIHRYKQESPYECLAALFTIEGPHRRIAPSVVLWNAQRELQKFVDALSETEVDIDEMEVEDMVGVVFKGMIRKKIYYDQYGPSIYYDLHVLKNYGVCEIEGGEDQ